MRWVVTTRLLVPQSYIMCSHSTIFLRQGFADLIRDLKHVWEENHPFSFRKKRKGRQNAVACPVHSTLGGGAQELEAGGAWMKLVL